MTATKRGAMDLIDSSLEVIRSEQAPREAFVAATSYAQSSDVWLRDGAFIAEALDLAAEAEMGARFHEPRYDGGTLTNTIDRQRPSARCTRISSPMRHRPGDPQHDDLSSSVGPAR
jgi:hypothetical protein